MNEDHKQLIAVKRRKICIRGTNIAEHQTATSTAGIELRRKRAKRNILAAQYKAAGLLLIATFLSVAHDIQSDRKATSSNVYV